MNSDELREKEKAKAQAASSAEKSQPSGCLIGGGVFIVLACIFGSSVGTGGAWFILIIAVVVGIIIANANSKKTSIAVSNAEKNISSLQETRRKNIDTMIKQAQDSGFVFSKSVMNMTNTSCLALDTKNNQLLIKAETSGSSYKVLKYRQMISYEICKDGNSVVSGDGGGSALVGGLLFGTVGAIAGAASSTQSIKNYCSEMYISIVDDAAHRYKIPLIRARVEESSYDYKIAIERAREMVSILEVVDKYNKSTLKDVSQYVEKKAPVLPKPSNSTTSNLDNIKKLKELLDMGALTQEEFDAKKKEYLGL